MQKCNARLVLVLVFLLIPVSSANAPAGERVSINQKDFGIAPNSDEDQTARIQRYLNETDHAGGGRAHLSAGYYTIKGSLTIPTGVTLTGSWLVPHHGILQKGTVLRAYGGRGSEDGPPLLEMQQSSGVKGLTIVYPEQKLADIKPYPWTIRGRGMHNTIEDITLVNSYQGIYIGPEFAELHLIRNVFGCVLRRGIFIDNTTDIGRIENVHFNPHYWSRSGHDGISKDARPNPTMAVARHMNQNLEAFIFARTDWEYVTNTFVYGAKIGYRFIANEKKGACNGQFHGIGADMCRYCVWVDETQLWGILISNGQFVPGRFKKDHSGDRVAIYTSPKFNGTVQLSNCSFWGVCTNVMRFEGPGCVTISQANFTTGIPTRKPVIDVQNGRASITNCFFNCKGPHVRVAEGVKKVLVCDNLARDGVQVVNNAADRLAVRNNE